MDETVKRLLVTDVELKLLNSLIRYQINRLEEELDKSTFAEEQRQINDDIRVYEYLLTKLHFLV